MNQNGYGATTDLLLEDSVRKLSKKVSHSPEYKKVSQLMVFALFSIHESPASIYFNQFEFGSMSKWSTTIVLRP